MTRPSPTNAFREHNSGSFEHFYLNNVAITEGCGCQEAVIRYFGPHQGGNSDPRGLLSMISSLCRWITTKLGS